MKRQSSYKVFFFWGRQGIEMLVQCGNGELSTNNQKQILGMNKICCSVLLLVCLVALSSANVCFGEECQHISVQPTTNPVDPVAISRAIEQEIRRQYWYYLRNANLLFQGNLNLPGRLMIFYFHRNIVGTFFTIASWDFDERVSQVNTLVRLGNGYSADVQTNYDPVNIDPFVLTLRLDDGEVEVQLADDGTLTIDGQVIDLSNNPNVDPTDAQARCIEQSDAYLRKTYWYYLNQANMISKEGLTTNVRVYALLTYVNIVGTFLVITSCEEEVVKANTFVRLGAGATTGSRNIIIDPIVLQFQN